MITKVTHCTLTVASQEDALAFWTTKMGFEVVMNVPMPGCADDDDKSDKPKTTMRWITVRPPQQPELQVVLQPPEWGPDDSENRKKRIGNVAGLVLESDDIAADFKNLQEKAVVTLGDPQPLPWGMSVMFKDQDGNVHNIVQPPSNQSS